MIEVNTRKAEEAAEEAAEGRFEESIHGETPEEEFGLVGGPLGHLDHAPLDETFFNAALWEEIIFQPTLSI